MLYAPSRQPFSDAAFQNPGACYRGAPFWAWNTLITRDMIEKQIMEFKQMGMGGFHIHVRVGLKNEYLSDEFMELVRFCNEKAKENGMLCWLYDEDRYSSGIAGGEVTKVIAFRAKWLKLSARWDERMLGSHEALSEKLSRNEKARGCFLTAYDVELESGYLKSARAIGRDEPARGVKWYCYLEFTEESPWCNDQTYVDTMMPEAIAAFIRITHERYAQSLQEDFGRSVPAIFTDEPHINGLRLPERADAQRDILLPYTERLPDEFGVVNGKDFFAAIPYLVWNRRDEAACPERYRYFRTISRLFVTAYCGQIGDWCERHGLLSTGHLLGEDSVRGQAAIVGDAMRCYRDFQLPGIDNLCDHRDFSAAKQAASIARQYRKEGVMSELYGVTQWDFDFKGYKLAGDWQAALGVTVRVPHLAWASMNGEAKRDYPAAIGWQSPWYQDFSYLENHYARLNYCLTRGRAIVHVGVLHPVESFWLLQGPADQTEDRAKQLEDDFQNLTTWLLTGGIDFDYIAESSLEDDGPMASDGAFHCGDGAYGVVLIPSCIHIRKATLDKLIQFSDAGGTVIFLGDPPAYADCRKEPLLDQLLAASERMPLSRQAILDRLAPWREVAFLENGQKRPRNLLHQIRQEEHVRWLFIAQAYKGMEARQADIWSRRPLHTPQRLEISIKGRWDVTQYDTLTGAIRRLPARHRDGLTLVDGDLYGNDSLLLRLDPPEGQPFPPDRQPRQAEACYPLPEPESYVMSEPNVLLLDRFEFALDDEAYQPAREMLALDNQLRGKLGFPLRCEALAQPYVRVKDNRPAHRLRLRTRFHADVPLSGCSLALEMPANCSGRLNGQPIAMKPCGFYVDPAIATIPLPDIMAGENLLELMMDYDDGTDLEWMYILGDFGVALMGAHTRLCPKPEKLYWGDYTRQGFPFYTGNITYLARLPAECAGRDCALQVPYYAGAAVKVSADDGQEKMLAFLPHECALDGRESLLRLTCLGNRYNGFGQLHLIGDDLVWLGPDSWRSEGASWTDVYQVRAMGILSAPLIKTYPMLGKDGQ